MQDQLYDADFNLSSTLQERYLGFQDINLIGKFCFVHEPPLGRSCSVNWTSTLLCLAAIFLL